MAGTITTVTLKCSSTILVSAWHYNIEHHLYLSKIALIMLCMLGHLASNLAFSPSWPGVETSLSSIFCKFGSVSCMWKDKKIALHT